MILPPPTLRPPLQPTLQVVTQLDPSIMEVIHFGAKFTAKEAKFALKDLVLSSLSVPLTVETELLLDLNFLEEDVMTAIKLMAMVVHQHAKQRDYTDVLEVLQDAQICVEINL